MGITSGHLSGKQFPTSLAVHTDAWSGPDGFVGGSKALMGGQGRFAFKSKDVSHTHGEAGFASLGKWNRQQTVNFDSMDTPAPSFPAAQ